MGNNPPRRKKVKRPAYVYTLNLSNGRKYVGMTNNPSRRFGQHWGGNGAKWTQKYRPVSVHSIKKYKSRKGAERGERGQYRRMKRMTMPTRGPQTASFLVRCVQYVWCGLCCGRRTRQD